MLAVFGSVVASLILWNIILGWFIFKKVEGWGNED